MISMNRPSRGDRESVTTTRYAGRRLDPIRLSRIETTCLPPCHGKSRERSFAFELLHHLSKLRVLLQQPVHVLHARAAAARDPLAARSIDHVGMRSLSGRHRRDDRVEAPEIGLFGAEFLRRAAQRLAERQHAEDLVEWTHLLQLS